MKVSFRLIVAVVIGLAIFAGGMIPGSVQAEEEIRIGVCLPMTGQVAAFGQMEWAGVQVANKMAPTALGRTVKLFLVDEKSDKIEAANAVSRLIKKEKVHAIIGSATSSNTMSGTPIAEKAQIPMVSPTATNPLVTQNKKYTFRVCFIDPFQGKIAARHAYDNLKRRNAAILIDKAQDYCVGLANFFKKEFLRLGGKIAAITYCQTGDQDFSAQLSSISASKADLLYIPNYYSENALVARQAEELGLDFPILSADGAQVPELIEIGGDAVEGMALTGHFHKEGAVTQIGKDFIKKFEAEENEEPSAFHALAPTRIFCLLTPLTELKAWKVRKSEKHWQVRKTLKPFPALSISGRWKCREKRGNS